MTRNHLLHLSARPLPTDRPGVWRMTFEIIGLAFGAPSRRREGSQ